MGIEHKILNFYGVQFHPESYLSEDGMRILKNWCEL
jgi:para-aminobenzoate synthetase component 2